jgi:hypothetical protein
MIRKMPLFSFMLLFLQSLSSNAISASLVDDDVLIRPEFVEHFKGKYPTLNLSIDIHNAFKNEERVRKKKILSPSEVPSTISIFSLKDVFPDLEREILLLIGGRNPGDYEIIATISFSDATNVDEIEGTKLLKLAKEE